MDNQSRSDSSMDVVWPSEISRPDCEYSPEQMTTLNYLIVGLLVALTLLICGGNLLIFLAFARSRDLKTMTNFYVVQLAVTDLGVGCIMPFHIATFVRPDIVDSDVQLCLLRYILFIYFCSASICGLTALTYDRYFAVTDPLRYNSATSTLRYVVSTCLIWIVPFVGAVIFPLVWHQDLDPDCPECELILILPHDYFRAIIIPAFSTVSILMVAFYARIFYLARRQVTSIWAIDVIPQTRPRDYHVTGSLRQQMKLVKAGFIVFAAFYACWLPFFVTLSVQIYSGDFNNRTVSTIRTFVTMVSVVNSVVNPVIYAFRLPLFKHELRRMLNITTKPCKQPRD